MLSQNRLPRNEAILLGIVHHQRYFCFAFRFNGKQLVVQKFHENASCQHHLSVASRKASIANDDSPGSERALQLRSVCVVGFCAGTDLVASSEQSFLSSEFRICCLDRSIFDDKRPDDARPASCRQRLPRRQAQHLRRVLHQRQRVSRAARHSPDLTALKRQSRGRSSRPRAEKDPSSVHSPRTPITRLDIT